MKLILKQKIFTWLDSYNVYGESGETLYTVGSAPALSHHLIIYDAENNPVGEIRQRIFTWLPKFDISVRGVHVGEIRRDLTLFKPHFTVDFNGWQLCGDFFALEYTVLNQYGHCIATVSRELWRIGDTYSIEVYDEKDVLEVLILALAVDAERCSSGNS